MIAITGATGQLGQHVIENLLKTTPASHLVAIVRNPKKAAPLSQRGIAVRQADYANEAALTTALQGVDKLLLISSSEVGQRTAQHRNVIQAAIAAKVKFIAYTSCYMRINRRWRSPMNILKRKRCWLSQVFLTRYYVTAGIRKTTWRASLPR